MFEVVTPENVPFHFELGSVPARALAWAVDMAVMGAAIVLVGLGVDLLVGRYSEGMALALYLVAAFIVQWGYGTVLEWAYRGQTIGKRLLRLRVLSAAGTRISFLQALVRNLVRVVDMLPSLYLVAGAAALVDPLGRRLGDLAAGTVVVYEPRPPRPKVLTAVSERHNSLLSDPQVLHAVGRISAPEREAMWALSMRRDTLPTPVRHRLFARLADHLEQRLGVPRPPFMSHEKFVLHLTTASVAASVREPFNIPVVTDRSRSDPAVRNP